GSEKPIFAKRPVPASSGRIYFCKPSERNIKPTASRQRSVGIADVLTIFFIFNNWKMIGFDVEATKFLKKIIQRFYLFLLNQSIPNFAFANLSICSLPRIPLKL